MSPSQSTSDSNKERQKWTPESDRMLTAAVAEATEKGESVSWLKVAEAIPGRTNKNCRKRWHYKIANDFRKGPWSPEEDDRLRAAVEVHGTKWSKVSQLVETRNGDQCWKRWHDNLNPEYDHSPWTEEEDARLLQAVEEMGRSWRDIVNRHFPSRTSLGAKNRYGLLQRRIGNTTSSTSTSTKSSKKQKTDPERRNTLDSTVSEAEMSDMMLLDNPNMFTNQAIDDMLMSAECDMSTNALVDWSWSVPLEDKHLPVTMTMDVATYGDHNSALVSSSSTTMCPTAVDFANVQQFTENYHTFMNVPSPTSSETQNLSRNNSSDSAQSSTSTISKEVQLRVTCMADQVQDVMSGMSTLLNNMMIKGDVSSVSFAVEQ